MNPTPQKDEPALTESTTVSVKLLLAVTGILIPVGGAWWHMTSQLRDIVYELRLLRKDVSAHDLGKLDRGVWEAWVREREAWIRAVRALNPGIIFPD